MTIHEDAAPLNAAVFRPSGRRAMESAVSFMIEIKATNRDLERGFLAYKSKRALRTARVEFQSREIGQYISSGRCSCTAAKSIHACENACGLV